MLFFQQQSNAVTRIYSTDNSLLYLTSTFLGQLGGALLQIPKMSKLEFLLPCILKISARHIFFGFFGAIVFIIRFLSIYTILHS